jgi:hypothetical protein
MHILTPYDAYSGSIYAVYLSFDVYGEYTLSSTNIPKNELRFDDLWLGLDPTYLTYCLGFRITLTEVQAINDCV